MVLAHMKAILSDIHGNLEAVQAVLADIARYPVDAIYCLGDLVGYGPNPRECVDLAMRWQVILRGNFDQALLTFPPGLVTSAISANESLRYAFGELNTPTANHPSAQRRWNFLNKCLSMHREENFLFVHGSAHHPVNEWVFPEEIYNPGKMDRIFSQVNRYCFQGHTHLPGLFLEGDAYRYLSPAEVDHAYRLDGRKTLCNVGSVGQPRDGDRRACYVLLDGEDIRFRRVEYDVETTIRKIRDLDDLANFLGDRLRNGR
jgi:predicted phosphodiesterase